MESGHNSELERVRFEKMRHISIFINSIVFRNMHEHSALELAIVLPAEYTDKMYIVYPDGDAYTVTVRPTP